VKVSLCHSVHAVVSRGKSEAAASS